MAMRNKNIIYWTELACGQWPLMIAATNKGLCYVGSKSADVQDLFAWSKKRFPNHELVECAEALKSYEIELINYLNGKHNEFKCPLDIDGTVFQKSVWQALQEIPYGHTVSYTNIAKRIGKPEAVRAVGTAIGANPVLIRIPCHRVIAKSGKLAGYRGGLEMKKQLLAVEKSD